MAWSVLQSAKNQANGTTVTATFGSNCTAGSTLIAAAVTSSSGTVQITGVADSHSNNLISLATTNVANNSGLVGIGIWALNIPAADVGTTAAITVTQSLTGDIAVLIQEVSGIVTGATLAALVDGTPGTIGAGTSTTTTGNPTYSSSVANEYLVAVYGDDGDSTTYTHPLANVDANSVNSSALNDLAIAYGNSTGGAETTTWSLSGGSAPHWGVIALAFKITAGAAPRPALPLQAVQPPQPAPQPRARLIGLTPGAFISGATLSGSGTLTAAPYFDATGTVLSGSGTLAAAPTVLVPATGIIRAPAQPPQPPPPAPSQITGAAPVITFTVGATLTGSGTLIAAPFFSAAAALSGSGTLTAGPGVGGFPVVIQPPVPQPAQPPQPPPSRVLLAPPALLLGSATLTGSGTLAAVPYFSAAAALSGSGTLAAVYTVAGAQPYILTAVVQPQQPPPAAPGRLLTAPSVTFLGAATLTGSGTLTAAETLSIAAALSGIGTLAAAYVGPPGFTVGTLTASDAPGGGGVLTASDKRTGGPGG